MRWHFDPPMSGRTSAQAPFVRHPVGITDLLLHIPEIGALRPNLVAMTLRLRCLNHILTHLRKLEHARTAHPILVRRIGASIFTDQPFVHLPARTCGSLSPSASPRGVFGSALASPPRSSRPRTSMYGPPHSALRVTSLQFSFPRRGSTSLAAGATCGPLPPDPLSPEWAVQFVKSNKV